MLEHLDQREVEAVLIHELAHIERRDAFILWLGRVLRDAFWYLPTSRKAYQLLQQEKEMACDDRVVEVTRRPLALASALTKVWLHAVEGGSPTAYSPVQPLVGTDGSIETRIERLLAHPDTDADLSRQASDAPHTSSFGVLELVEVVTFLLPVVLIACSPVLALGR